ncbi:MAG: fibronectin type III domain-containing protein, partial [Bacteroidia bacterium]|nr:fibronectin type III domain-containing protein [Bacteroidia bacterium]
MTRALLVATAWIAANAPSAFGQTCSGVQTFTLTSGTISDGSGAAPYSNGLDCGFLIQSPGATAYTLVFTQFSLQNGPDKLIVYRGSNPAAEVEAVLTGSNLPSPLTVYSSAVYLRFLTDGAVVAQGWSLNYSVLNPPPGPTCAGTTMIFPGAGTVNDGSGPAQYSNNLDCKWILSPSSSKTITLTFTDFDVRPVEDRVDIYRGEVENPANLLASYSGSNIPASVTAQGNPAKMLVAFRTDGENQAGGFTFDYFASNGFCAGNARLTAQSGTVTDGSGTSNYAGNSVCGWLIKPQFPADRIRIVFTQFNTQANRDFVRVYAGENQSGTLLGSFSGTNLPPPIVVNGPAAFVYFTSDPTVHRQGWSFNYNLEYNPCSPPSNLQAAVSGEAVQLTWNPHGGTSSPYRLTVVGQGGYEYTVELPFGTTQHIIPDLPAGRDYTATLVAYCAPGSPLTATFSTPCPAPPQPVVDEFTRTDDYVAIFWNPVSDVLGYRYELYAQGALYQTQTVPQGPAQFSGLNAGTDYVFRLYNQCYNGLSSSYAQTTFSTPCPVPGGLEVEAGAIEATATWNAPAGVPQYALELSDNHGGTRAQNVATTSATFTELVPGTNYTFKVRSLCVNATQSPEATATFSTLCPQVVEAVADYVGTRSAVLSWQTVLGQNHVRIRVRDGAGQTVFDGANDEGTLTLSNLTPSTAYVAEIFTLCRDFDSEPVAIAFETGACAAPSDLELVETGEDDATISWAAVGSAVRYLYVLSDDDEIVFSGNVASTSVQFDGLIPGVEYVFEVRSECEEDVSAASSLGFWLDCPAPTGLTVEAQADAAQLTWQSAIGALNYRISLYRFGESEPVVERFSSETSVALDGLQPGTRYLVRVATVCEDVPSAEAEIEFYTVCPPPAEGEVEAGVYEASAVWSSVAGANVYTVYLNGDYRETVFETGLSLSGLEPGTAYLLQIATACNDIESPALDLPFQTVCPQVQDVYVEEIGTNYIVFFIEPIAGVRGYRFVASALNEGQNVAQDFDVSPDHVYILSGLSPGEDYYIDLYTLCNDATSDPVSGDLSTLCIPQTGLEVGDVTSVSAVAVWDDLSEYGYLVAFDGGEPFIVYENVLTLENLSPGN